MIPSHDHRTVGRQFHGGEPFGVQPSVGAVRHYQGKSFVEQRQDLAIPFSHTKAELLPKFFHWKPDHLQTGDPALLDQAQGHQPLDKNCVIMPVRQLLEGHLKGRSGDNLQPPILAL